MSPKKEIKQIRGFGVDPEAKLVVQKSLPLFTLWQSDMSLAEFKILDAYLARINSHDPDGRTVTFYKGELEELLGVTKINKADLESRVNSLARFVDVKTDDENKVHKIALFEEIVGERDRSTGLWTINLTCTQKAMKYIFNIEHLGYLRYRLHSILSLGSRYSYILFLYIEKNRIRKTWEIGVDELRRILNCESEESYQEFKIFNNRVLRRCQKEIQEKTDCRFTYTPVRRGRKVSSIRFDVETLAEKVALVENMEQITFDGVSDDDPNAIYAEMLPSELTPEQVEALRFLAAQRVPWDPSDAMPRSVLVANYLRHQVVMMNARKGDPIERPFAYLKKMIENDPLAD